MESLAKTYDVAIVGAGPAGSALAITLRQKGFPSVLLADAGKFDQERVGESVPPDIRILLDYLGVLPAFLQENHDRCVGSCSSWGSSELRYNDFAVNLHGSGWHLNRTRFDQYLARCAQTAGADLRLEFRFQSVNSDGAAGYRLTFQDAHEVSHSTQARIVVDASGKSCQLARSLGAQRLYDDKLTCVAGSFALHPDAPVGQLTVLESCSYGWWYAARLPGDRAIVSVTSDAAIVRERSLNQPQSWLWHLSGTQHIGPQLGDSGFLNKHFKTFPCPSYRLDQVQGNRWLAVGDAAMSFDPISAQGIYKALHSGIIAADQIQSGVHAGASSYALFVKSHYSEYLKLRHHLYSQEQRFREHPFWKLRHRAVNQSAAAQTTRF